MEIKRNGTSPSAAGPAEYFTGRVRFDYRWSAPDPASINSVKVTFEPGARTAWHTHPLGQTLLVTDGVGWAQVEGGERQEIRPGDLVWFAPNERHWHGATTEMGMTHIAMQESLDGVSVTWEEHVADDDYLSG